VGDLPPHSALEHVLSVELLPDACVAFLETDGLFSSAECIRVIQNRPGHPLSFQKLNSGNYTTTIVLSAVDSNAAIPALQTKENEAKLAEIFTVPVFEGTTQTRSIIPSVQLVPRFFRRNLRIGAVEFPVTPSGELVCMFPFVISHIHA
jgi:hypothetical protein